MKTFVSRYGSPDTRLEVEHEEDECAACVAAGGVPDGSVIFMVVEYADGAEEIRRIEGLGGVLGFANLRMNGCHNVSRADADAEIARAHAEGRSPS